MNQLIKKAFAFAVFSLVFILSVQASHVMAGEITYKSKGTDSLEVTVTAYRDCNGIYMANTLLQASTDSCGTIIKTLNLFSSRDVTGIPVSCGIKSRCTGSYQYGIEEYVYKGVIYIGNINCCKLTLAWEQCCRNASINTGAENQNFYIETTYDKCLAPNNSSPRFLNLPVMLLPLGQDVNVTHAAVDDIDNDYVTYQLINPLSAKGSNIGYSNQWSPQKPLTFLGFPNVGLKFPAGFHFDSLTSNMAFRPAKKDQVTVVTIKVREWRKINGTFKVISEIIRDVQLIVYESPSNFPPRINKDSKMVIKSCAPAGNYCFVIPVADQDTTDTLKVNYKHNFKNITVNTTFTKPSKAEVKVCFTIDSALLSSIGSYFFSLYAEDDNCPLAGKAEKTFFLQIDSSGPSPLILSPVAAICETAPPITLLGAPAYGKWAGTGVTADSIFSPSTAGTGWHKLTYTYNDTSSGCISKDSINVRVVKAPKAGFTASATTGKTTDVFTFTDTTVADTAYQKLWNLGQPTNPGNIQALTVVNHTYNAVGTYMVKLWVSNVVCAPDSATATVVVTAPVSVKNALMGELKIYPNPTRDYLFIEAETAITAITITDMLGRNSIAETQNVGGETKLSLMELPTGVYYLQATCENGQIHTAKVMVQR